MITNFQRGLVEQSSFEDACRSLQTSLVDKTVVEAERIVPLLLKVFSVVI